MVNRETSLINELLLFMDSFNIFYIQIITAESCVRIVEIQLQQFLKDKDHITRSETK